ncbi:MAG: IclR family transcriptional regulator, partial [Actinobacteria bacterium]
GLQRVSPYTIVQPQHFVDQLGTIRQEGVAFDREESTIGLTCVAAPVLGPGGRAIAAVSLAGPTYRFRRDEFAGRVREAAVGIAQDFQAVA